MQTFTGFDFQSDIVLCERLQSLVCRTLGKVLA